MPANLTPQYVELEREYRAAKDPEQRLALLQRMLAEIPKHKGTEHMQGEIKHKISKLKKELQQKKGASRKAYLDHVPKEGIAQYALVGPPNTGKSTLLAALTNARPEIADFPFTTRKPFPGMTTYECIQLQLVDLPPICSQYCEGWVPNVVRTADVAIVVLSLAADDLLDGFENTAERLRQAKVLLDNSPPESDQPVGIMNKKSIFVANQIDRPGAGGRLEVMIDVFRDRFPIVPISAKEKTNLDLLKQAMFQILGKVRVYTKAPGHEPDFSDPIVLPVDATVMEAARVIHKDFAHNLQFARIWGKHTFDGQRVKGDFVISDGDILEFHV